GSHAICTHPLSLHDALPIWDEGIAVLLISAELDEILSLADRIAVIFHGQIVATMPAAEATRNQLGLLMAGSDAVSSNEDGVPEADRKSTRLNSSHVKISYAV